MVDKHGRTEIFKEPYGNIPIQFFGYFMRKVDPASGYYNVNILFIIPFEQQVAYKSADHKSLRSHFGGYLGDYVEDRIGEKVFQWLNSEFFFAKVRIRGISFVEKLAFLPLPVLRGVVSLANYCELNNQHKKCIIWQKERSLRCRAMASGK